MNRNYSYKKKNIWTRKRRRNNINVNIKDNLNRSLRRFIKGANVPSIQPLIGCSRQEFNEYFQGLFKDGMHWNNHGTTWVVDHKRAASRFDLTNLEERAQCYHYSNLQPLFKHENLKKSYL